MRFSQVLPSRWISCNSSARSAAVAQLGPFCSCRGRARHMQPGMQSAEQSTLSTSSPLWERWTGKGPLLLCCAPA